MMTPPRPAEARSRVAPSIGASSLRVFDLSLGQMLWSRRSLFLAVLLGGPVLLAALIRILVGLSPLGAFRSAGPRVAGPAVFGVMMWLLYVRFIVPVLGVFYGTSLIADEVEDKTITYLFTRPIRRGAVLLGKYFAYLACTALLVLPSIVLVYFLAVPLGGGSIGASYPALLKDLGAVAAGLVAYGAVFAWIGARVKRPLVAGLVFAFGWEPGVLLFPGYLKRATLAYYVQALVPQAAPADSQVGGILQAFREAPGVATSLAAIAVVSALALWSAVRTVESREYVLEQ
jgi:ABC-type Na+ efflux pump permease subunit